MVLFDLPEPSDLWTQSLGFWVGPSPSQAVLYPGQSHGSHNTVLVMGRIVSPQHPSLHMLKF